jgi:hypothetical protein
MLQVDEMIVSFFRGLKIKYWLIGSIVILVLLFIIVAHLKTYRLDYCTSVFPNPNSYERNQREKCMQRSLSDFIF